MAKRCGGCMQIKKQGAVCENCGFDENTKNAPGQLPIGTVLHGQYLVGKTLGQGGFGITYLGWDINLERQIAIKEYFPQVLVERTCAQSNLVLVRTTKMEDLFLHNRKRFLNEGRTLARMKDIPEIVQVYNFFEENNTAYIIMEYIRGVDLREHIQNIGRPMTVQETLFMMRPIMEALTKLHETGLIHRDISPDNIMLQTDGSTKLLDFGAVLEVCTPDVHKELERSTEAIMKHGFAPFEQYQRRGTLGPWTDVYALCATIFYCVTGSVPPGAPDRIAGDENINWANIQNLTERQIAMLERGMALLPQDRVRSVKELYNMLYLSSVIDLPEKPQTINQQQLIKVLAATAAALWTALLFMVIRGI